MTTRVTAVDVESGDTETREITDDYNLVCDGRCYLDSVQTFGNGTHVLTIKTAPDVELTRFPDGEGFIDYAWDNLTFPMRSALAEVVARSGRSGGEATYRALRKRGLVMGAIATERGEAVMAWAYSTGRWSR